MRRERDEGGGSTGRGRRDRKTMHLVSEIPIQLPPPVVKRLQPLCRRSLGLTAR